MTKAERTKRHQRELAESYGRFVKIGLSSKTYPLQLIYEDAVTAFHSASLARCDGYFGEGRNRTDGPERTNE